MFKKRSELKKECMDLNLNVIQLGKKEANEDYETALRNYFLAKDYPNGLPEHLKLILEFQNPMLCFNYKHMKPEQQQEIWDSDDWFLEQKFDGLRALPCFLKSGFEVYGRNNSIVNYRKNPYGSKLPKELIDFSKIKDDFILDSEVVCTEKQIVNIFRNKGIQSESNLQAMEALYGLNDEESLELQRHYNYPVKYFAFTCLYYNGVWLFDRTERERRDILENVYLQLQAANYPVILSKVIEGKDNKKAFYDQMIKEGNEGCVAKKWTGKYTPTSSRLRTGWVKIKGEIGERMELAGMGDTIDGFVTGFEMAEPDSIISGLVGSLKISIFIQKPNGELEEKHIATCSNIDYDFRKQITEIGDNGEPQLSSMMYGRVYEISGQSISPVNKRLKHAIIVRPRFDKNANECIIAEEFFNSFIY